MIELACGHGDVSQISTLGHELFHAVEISAEPSIVDARTLVAFYSRIGVRGGDAAGHLTFETDAAANAGQQARLELRFTDRPTELIRTAAAHIRSGLGLAPR